MELKIEDIKTALEETKSEIKSNIKTALQAESDAGNEVKAALDKRLKKIEDDLALVDENIKKTAAFHVPGMKEELAKDPFDYGLFIRAALNQSKGNQGAWDKAGYEKEIIEEYAKAKDMIAGDGSQGGYLIPPDAAQPLVDMTIAKTPILSMGTTNIPDAVGEIPIPRQTARNTAYWVGETEAPDESSITFDDFYLRPKKIGVLTRYSNRLNYQTRGAITNIIMDSISDSMGLGVHTGYLQGTGNDSQPKGVLTQTGYTTTPNQSNNAVRFRIDKAASMIQAIDTANELIDGGNFGFIMRPEVMGGMRRERVPQFTGQPIGQGMPIAQSEILMSNEQLAKRIGYMLKTTTQLSAVETRGTSSTSSTVIFGNWKQFYTAQWRGLEIKVSDTAAIGGKSAMARDFLWVVAFMEVDSNVGRVTAFTLAEDAETAEANWSNG